MTYDSWWSFGLTQSCSTTLWAPARCTSIIMRQCKDKGHISPPQEKPQSTSTGGRGGRGSKWVHYIGGGGGGGLPNLDHIYVCYYFLATNLLRLKKKCWSKVLHCTRWHLPGVWNEAPTGSGWNRIRCTWKMLEIWGTSKSSRNHHETSMLPVEHIHLQGCWLKYMSQWTCSTLQYIADYCSFMCKSTCLPTARKKNTTEQNSKWINGWMGNLANPCNGWGEEHDKSKNQESSTRCANSWWRIERHGVTFLVDEKIQQETQGASEGYDDFSSLFPLLHFCYLLLCLLFVSLGCSNWSNIYQHNPRPCLHLNE